MKKFVFSLDKVLNFKAQTLDIKNNEMLKMQVELKEVEQKIYNLNNDFAETNQRMILDLQSGLAPMDMAAYKLYLNEINNKIRNYNMLKANLLSLIDKKMAIIIELKTDISGLEHLKEKQFGEYFRLNQKEQEINLEEFVSRSRYFAV
ncbi:MAG: hypothetical protein PHN47_02035 [Clostridia bacterium]|nr:hypothetical protein [Clostridia bacterium]